MPVACTAPRARCQLLPPQGLHLVQIGLNDDEMLWAKLVYGSAGQLLLVALGRARRAMATFV